MKYLRYIVILLFLFVSIAMGNFIPLAIGIAVYLIYALVAIVSIWYIAKDIVNSKIHNCEEIYYSINGFVYYNWSDYSGYPKL